MNARSEGSDRVRSVPLTREFLAKLKQRACRRGVWFSVLKLTERRLLDLTISVVQRVQSFVLAKLVSVLVNRLDEVMESRVVCLIRSEGKKLVKQLSEIGQGWGNKAAKSWAKEHGFMQYLTINCLEFRF